MINTDMSTVNIEGPFQPEISVTYERQNIPKPSWLGHDVQIIYPKSPFWIAFQSVIAAILIVVGVIIVNPILGGLIIGAGVFMGAFAIKKMIEPDELEETVKYLANTEDLDALPEINWEIKEYTNVNTGKKSGTNITTWKSSDMTHNVMALKENGKTIAVAFKSEADRYVTVITLKNQLTGFLFGSAENGRFNVCTFLDQAALAEVTNLFKRLQ